MVCRYETALPHEIAAAVAEAPVAWVPWGGLEWHGPHLPLGLDGAKAHALCLRAAERAGGVVLPPTYLPATTVPHPWSISLAPATLHALWLDVFGELERVGFELICCLSGHHAPPHTLTLIEAAEAYMRAPHHRAIVVALGDVELVRSAVRDPSDHGGRWETALARAIAPERVQIERLDPQPLREWFAAPESFRQFGVLGRDPRQPAPGEEGEAVLTDATEAWLRLVEYLRSTGDRDAVAALYQRVREEYSGQRGTIQAAYVAAGSPANWDWQQAWDDHFAGQLGEASSERHRDWFKSRWW